MCGIVGLFLKDRALEPKLGALLSEMLISLSDRGPDSAGIAIYGDRQAGRSKITVQSAEPRRDFAGLEDELAEALGDRGQPDGQALACRHRAALGADRGGQRSFWPSAALPFASWAAARRSRSTRRSGCRRTWWRASRWPRWPARTASATPAWRPNSAVTTLGAHPFSTGADQCLVHNGSLSNHNNVRRELIRDGMRFETENDTEVAAAYLTARMARARTSARRWKARSRTSTASSPSSSAPGPASASSATRSPASPPCWPRPTSMSPSARSIARWRDLPGIESATVWEPEPATVYFWEH